LIAAWLSTRGTSRRDSLSTSDGFRGEHPFASAVTVAEGTGAEQRSAVIAASIIRDVFAEGVAYRIGEALAEAFSEAGERIRAEELRGCSATAAAVLGRDAWIVHAGGCRAWIVGASGARALTEEHTLAGEMGISPGDPGYRQRSRHLTLQLGQKDLKPQSIKVTLGEGECILLASSEVWRHIDQAGLHAALRGGRGLEAGLEHVLRESKVRFRRQGGSVAAACPGEGQHGGSRGRRLHGLTAFLAVCAVAASVFLLARPSCGHGRHGAGAPGAPDTTAEVPMILPIPDIAETLAAAPRGPALPVRGIIFGSSPVRISPETLSAFSTPLPDTLYENLSPGVYFASSDSVLRPVAEAVASRFGLPPPVPLERIIIVREADVPAFAAWLPRVDASEARSTAVVVETRSSVAGGAPWIRSYALYANGDRSRKDDPSSYVGSPVEGLPAMPDTAGYRLLVVP